MKNILLLTLLAALFILTPFRSPAQCLTDNIPPTAICQNVTVYLDATGLSHLTPNQIDAGSFDNCSIDVLLIDGQALKTFSCSYLGIQPVMLTVIDSSGNTANCMANVTVVDTITPTIICTSSYTTYLNSLGMVNVLATALSGGSFDNCQLNTLINTGNSLVNNYTYDTSYIGGHTITVYVSDASGNSLDSCVITLDLIDTFGLVRGFVNQDLNLDCIKDNNEVGAIGRTLLINPGNIVVTTDENGVWWLDSLPFGNYTITIDTTGGWQSSCPSTQNFSVTQNTFVTFSPDFGQYNPNGCPAPSVSIGAITLRPGFSNQVICGRIDNLPRGTNPIDSGYVIVSVDPLINVNTSNLPYTSLGNNQYRIDLNPIVPGSHQYFYLGFTLSNSAVINQTLCMSSQLYIGEDCYLDSIPNPFPTSFTPCNSLYDQSHLDINAVCHNDTISFTIINNGSGDMSCVTPVRTYLDGVYQTLDSIQLLSGDSMVYSLAGNGQTWRMEVNQHPLHPGSSNPSATIERCGNLNNWTPNLINILPLNDADPNIDISCQLVRGSYDPNDKTGYPLGLNSTHDIAPNQDLTYHIRFQNTGTDTAFTVVIRDTLSTDLNIFTVESGAASHDYTFRMYGPRVLEWTFNNILLPDSTTNNPASQGFVSFKVKQVPNLPIGRVIENSAAIYFDYNLPIITNTYFHTINENLIVLSLEPVHKEIKELKGIEVYPNPTQEIIWVEQEETEEIFISVINALGETILTQKSANQKTQFDFSTFPNGLYILTIKQGTASTSKKIIKIQ
jgi:uncharacterized repeat protein (TIGR01451 family)